MKIPKDLFFSLNLNRDKRSTTITSPTERPNFSVNLFDWAKEHLPFHNNHKVTYDELYNLIQKSQLKTGHTYEFIFNTIYDQVITNITKTGADETLVATATSPNTLDVVVKSLDYPKDVIHYDVNDRTTTTNSEPTKGRIIYREDENGNSAGYDWRAVLNYDGTNEFLTFVGSPFALNNISGYKIEGAFVGQEFPNVIFKELTARNEDNYFLNSVFEDDFIKNSNCEISGSTFTGEFGENSDCKITDSVFEGDVLENSNCNFEDCVFEDVVAVNSDCNFEDSVFEDVVLNNSDCNFEDCVDMDLTVGNKGCIFENLDNISITQNFNVRLNGADINISRCCNIFIELVDATDFDEIRNCSGMNDTGLSNCNITGSGTSGETFQNNFFLALVNNKTLTQALYPELFEDTSCTIYKNDNGDYYYEYRDSSNVVQTRQIL